MAVKELDKAQQPIVAMHEQTAAIAVTLQKLAKAHAIDVEASCLPKTARGA